MNKADEALAEVRRWLCDSLSDGDAGKVCGMLSVVSRRIVEIEDENDKLRELVLEMRAYINELTKGLPIHDYEIFDKPMHELGVICE